MGRVGSSPDLVGRSGPDLSESGPDFGGSAWVTPLSYF